MKKSTIALLAASAIAASAGARAQDAAAGKQVYAQCIACHAASAANGVGPGLLGIVGRKSGTAPGFRYSPAMKRANKTWDAATLEAYLADPQQSVPGNTMPFAGLPDGKQRADLLAYLLTLK